MAYATLSKKTVLLRGRPRPPIAATAASADVRPCSAARTGSIRCRLFEVVQGACRPRWTGNKCQPLPCWGHPRGGQLRLCARAVDAAGVDADDRYGEANQPSRVSDVGALHASKPAPVKSSGSGLATATPEEGAPAAKSATSAASTESTARWTHPLIIVACAWTTLQPVTSTGGPPYRAFRLP